MTSYAKDIGQKVKGVSGEVIEPVARGAAVGSEKLAQGSEAIAEGARKLADMTQHWADEVTGIRRRRRLIWMALGLTIVGAVIYLLISSNQS
jgi:X-X-X-Leu-X-X-Gly heptad repeat protein